MPATMKGLEREGSFRAAVPTLKALQPLAGSLYTCAARSACSRTAPAGPSDSQHRADGQLQIRVSGRGIVHDSACGSAAARTNRQIQAATVWKSRWKDREVPTGHAATSSPVIADRPHHRRPFRHRRMSGQRRRQHTHPSAPPTHSGHPGGHGRKAAVMATCPRPHPTHRTQCSKAPPIRTSIRAVQFLLFDWSPRTWGQPVYATRPSHRYVRTQAPLFHLSDTPRAAAPPAR